MFSEHIYSNNCLVEFRVSGLYQLIVKVFLVLQRIKSFEHKFEERLQILRTWWRHKYIWITGKKKSYRSLQDTNETENAWKGSEIWIQWYEATSSYISLCLDKQAICIFRHKDFTHPNPTAVAIARPRAADLPRPLAAVITTVLLNVFSDIASTNFSNPLALNQRVRLL